MKLDEYNQLRVDLKGDLGKYRDLDELITINPREMSGETRQQFLQLCEICPEIKISDAIGLAPCTAAEYKKAEAWIDSVLQGLNPEWTEIQKIAFIDNAIGKKISYSPDFDTEVFRAGSARALWRIINSGYGVCNGIAQVEQYILDKAGIDAEMISSGIHVFLKLTDMELPTTNGGTIKGDTILDPTWNMAAHRYGAKPENFCRSYEEIRKNDIRSNGEDSKAHKNDESLASATLDLEEQALRGIFTSIGIADQEGNFPVKKLADISESIYHSELPEEEVIKRQFALLAEYYPDFATCQNSTTTILQGLLLKNEKFHFNRCVVNRVYHREDEDKEVVLYVYVDFPNAGKKFYFADKEIGQFTEIPQKEFEAKFECYDKDLEKQNGMRPWEISENEKEVEDLITSSGKVVAQEGEER